MEKVKLNIRLKGLLREYYWSLTLSTTLMQFADGMHYMIAICNYITDKIEVANV